MKTELEQRGIAYATTDKAPALKAKLTKSLRGISVSTISARANELLRLSTLIRKAMHCLTNFAT